MDHIRPIERSRAHPPVEPVPRVHRRRREDEREADEREQPPARQAPERPGDEDDGRLDVLA